MLIALLALLGVDLIVIVVLLAVMLSRKRWVTDQPGSFRGAVRVLDGDTLKPLPAELQRATQGAGTSADNGDDL